MSRADSEGEAAELLTSKMAAEVAIIPPIFHDDDIWIATCRPPYKHHVLDEETLVIYQPDCRLFCTKGAACKYLKSEDNEKDGPTKRAQRIDHQKRFIHVSNKVMKEAQLRRAFCGALNDYRWTIGASTCWTISEARSELPETLHSRSVVIYVHGFKQHCSRIISACTLLKRHFADHAERQGLKAKIPVILGFVWPSMSRALQYTSAREMAKSASVHLSRLIRVLHAQGCEISVVAHSLGARVSLLALLDQANRKSINHLFLLSPAVPSDSFQVDKRFPRNRLAVRNIYVCWSRNDKVLNLVYGIGEIAFDCMSLHRLKTEEAMGSHGLQSDDIDNCTSLDFSDLYKKHSVGAWLYTPELAELICDLLLRRPTDSPSKTTVSFDSMQTFGRDLATDSEDEDASTALPTADPSSCRQS